MINHVLISPVIKGPEGPVRTRFFIYGTVHYKRVTGKGQMEV